jgi:hypothetical protein
MKKDVKKLEVQKESLKVIFSDMGKYKNLGEAAINEVTGNLTLQINNLKKTLVRNDKIIENLKENITCLFNQA